MSVLLDISFAILIPSQRQIALISVIGRRKRYGTYDDTRKRPAVEKKDDALGRDGCGISSIVDGKCMFVFGGSMVSETYSLWMAGDAYGVSDDRRQFVFSF